MTSSLLQAFLPELQDHAVSALVTVSHARLRRGSESSMSIIFSHFRDGMSSWRRDQEDFVVLVSQRGFAKKVSLSRFSGLRPGKGMQAMKLAEGDELRWAHKAFGDSAMLLVTADGFSSRVSLGQERMLSYLKPLEVLISIYLALTVFFNADGEFQVISMLRDHLRSIR